jgi:hypothetical protein
MGGLVDLGRRGWATRDCPNVILPPWATCRVLNPMTDAWGGWPAGYLQIIAATAEEYVLTHAFVSGSIAGTATGNGNTFMLNHMHLQIGQGAAASEAVIAEAMAVSSVAFTVSGNTDLTTIIQGWDTITRTAALAPVVVPAGQRLAVRGQISGTSTLKKGGIYLSAYPTAALGYANIPGFDELFMRGCRPAWSDVQVITAPTTVTGSAGASYTTPGAWVQIGGALDADYLYDWATAIATSVVGSAQFEVGLGPDIDHVVVQARFGLATTTSIVSSADDELPLPFIGYTGEKLWVRVACTAGSKTFSVCLHAKRLN